MDEELVKALDKVLSLSGGDPTVATNALLDRIATQRGESTLRCTVPSPTMLSRPPERTSSQQMMTSSLSDQALAPPQKTSGTGRSPLLGRPETSQYALSCTSKFNTIAHSSTRSAHTVHANVCFSISTDSEDDEAVAPTLRPVLETSQPSERLANSTPEEPCPRPKLKGTSRPGPLPTSSSLSRAPTFPAIIRATRSRPVIQLPTDSEDEETVVSTFPPRSNPPPPDSTHEESCTHGGHVTESVVQTSTLDPSLAEIQPDDSDLEPSVFNALKRRISADPFYFGESHHIRLRNMRHSAAHRKVHLPTKNTRVSDKWHAIACGARVGIFTTWMSVAPHVLGKSRSVYKAFDTESDARVWLQSCLLRGTVELIN